MRLMTGREALNELHSLLPHPCTTTTHWDAGELERIHFLLDYIHGKLPADPDWEALAKEGIEV
jgi:hypothetical protein